MRVLLSVFFLFSSLCFASENEEEANTDGLVEVYVEHTYDEAYRDRRPSWSWDLAFQAESLIPEFYEDLNGNLYEDLFVDPISSAQIVFGPKYNTRLGSFSFGLIIGSGMVSGAVSGDKTTLALNKTGLQLGYMADTLTENPYVVPYANVQILKWDYSEKSSTYKNSGSSSPSMAYSAGLLIQLNWLDSDSARKGYSDSGLLNSYLDIYGIQYLPSSGAAQDEPDFQTAMSLGVGLRVEF